MQSPQVLHLMMDSLRYWVEEMHVDGFRFDLAAALARELHAVDRLSAFFDVIRQDPVDLAREAHRGAVGRRRRRLPGRQLPAGLGGMERPLPRRRAPVLAWRSGRAFRAGDPALGQQRPVQPVRPAAAREHQLRDLARRLHARRPCRLQREAQRGERRGQSRRRSQQPELELRRRGPDRRSGRSGRCACASGAISCSPCSSRSACRC